MRPLAAALLAFSFGSQGEGTHVSGAEYWLAERTGRLRSAELRKGVVHVSIFEHHGPFAGWLTVAERDAPEGKERGTLLAVQSFLAFLRSTIEAEREHGFEKLRALTGVRLDDVSYHHFHEATLGGPEALSLPPGGSIEKTYDHAAALESPLSPGPHSIRASFGEASTKEGTGPASSGEGFPSAAATSTGSR
jgi:hypothetical protein